MRINQEVLEVFITLVVVIVIRTSIVHLIFITSSSTAKLDSKTCRNCKYNNEAESIFCEECGKKLE